MNGRRLYNAWEIEIWMSPRATADRIAYGMSLTQRTFDVLVQPHPFSYNIYLFLWVSHHQSITSAIRPKLIPIRTARQPHASGKTFDFFPIDCRLVLPSSASCRSSCLMRVWILYIGWSLFELNQAIKLFSLWWCWAILTDDDDAQQWNLLSRMSFAYLYAVLVACMSVCMCVAVSFRLQAISNMYHFSNSISRAKWRHIVAFEMNFLFGHLDGITVRNQIRIFAADRQADIQLKFNGWIWLFRLFSSHSHCYLLKISYDFHSINTAVLWQETERKREWGSVTRSKFIVCLLWRRYARQEWQEKRGDGPTWRRETMVKCFMIANNAVKI